MPPQDFLVRLTVQPERGVRQVRRFRGELQRTENVADQLRGTIRNTFLGFGAAFVVRELGQVADAYTNLQNRIRVVTDSQSELAEVTSEVFRIANETRSAFDSTAEVYSRTALAVRELGISQEETLAFTQSLNQAVILSGAGAQEARAGLIQLSQGLGSGALRGDELRSVLEQLPVVADTIARSLGVTRGELRELGRDGAITAEVILKAFRDSREELESRFGETVPTLGQSFQVLRNNAVEAFGAIDQATGASAGLSAALLLAAGSTEALVVGTLILGVSALPAAVTGMAALVRQSSIFATIVRGGALFNPVIAGTAAAGVGVVALAGLFERSLNREVREANEQLELFLEQARGSDLQQLDTEIANVSRTLERIQTAIDEGIIDPSEVEGNIQALTARLDQLGQEFLQLSDGSQRSLADIRAQARATDQLTNAVDQAAGRLVEENRALIASSRELRIRKTALEEVARIEKELGQELSPEQEAQVRAAAEQAEALREQADAFERIRGPQIQFQADLDATRALLAEGRIEAEEARLEIERLFANAEGLDLSTINLDELGASVEGLDIDALRALLNDLETFQPPAEAPTFQGQIVQGDQPGSVLDAQLRAFDQINEPQRRFAEQQAALNALLDQGAISGRQYAIALNEATIAANVLGSGAGAGLSAGLAQIENQLLDIGGTTQNTLVTGFNDLTSEIVSFAQTGEFELDRFFNNLIGNLTQLATQQALLALLGGGGQAGIFGFNLFGGARQGGGGVNEDQLFQVNEVGQERFLGRSGRSAVIPGGPQLFAPPEDGQIIPADQAGAASPVVNVSAPPAMVKVVNVMDPKEIPAAMDSPEGEQVIVNTMSRRRGSLGRF